MTPEASRDERYDLGGLLAERYDRAAVLAERDLRPPARPARCGPLTDEDRLAGHALLEEMLSVARLRRHRTAAGGANVGG